MFELTSFLVFLIAACGIISVLAAPPMEPTAATNNDDGKMNKTTNEKSPSIARKAMRPLVAVPFYPPQMPPVKFQRLAPPTKFDPYGVNPSYVQRPASSYTGYQPAQMYPGYASPLAPAMSHPINPLYNYQRQPIAPSAAYNYAPYAVNPYTPYGYRSATEEEKVQPPTLVDLPDQPSVQYETVKYIFPQLEYQPDESQSNDYTLSTTDPSSSVVQPREMYTMGPQNRYDVMDDKISVNYMSPLAEPYDSVFFEMKRPYGYITRPATYPDMEPHQVSYRFTEPSGNYQAQSRPYLIDATNWALPAGQNVPSIYVM